MSRYSRRVNNFYFEVPDLRQIPTILDSIDLEHSHDCTVDIEQYQHKYTNDNFFLVTYHASGPRLDKTSSYDILYKIKTAGGSNVRFDDEEKLFN